MAPRHRTPDRKRANNDARPYWNDARAQYEVFVELPRGADGKRRRKRVHGVNERQCVEAATKLRATLLSGLDAPNDRRTVAQVLDLWLGTLPSSRLAPGTIVTYRRAVRLYVKPTLGSLVAEQVRPSHVRKMQAALADQGRAPHTVRLARAVLRRGFEWAVGDELLSRNVVANTDGPAVPGVKVDPLELVELGAVLDAARGHRYEAAVVLLARLGLRKGEVLGLAWSDVDLEAKPPVIHVRRQVQRVARRGLELVPLKTAKSDRVIPLDAVAVDTLRAQRRAQREERMLIGVRPGEEYAELVFTTAHGLPVDPRAFARSLDRIAGRAGLNGLNPHRLRHSMAAVALEARVPVEVLSELLGHSSIRVTKDIYGTLLLNTKAAAVDAIGGVFNEILSAPGGYQRGYPES
jgi:integrase